MSENTKKKKSAKLLRSLPKTATKTACPITKKFLDLTPILLQLTATATDLTTAWKSRAVIIRLTRRRPIRLFMKSRKLRKPAWFSSRHLKFADYRYRQGRRQRRLDLHFG